MSRSFHLPDEAMRSFQYRCDIVLRQSSLNTHLGNLANHRQLKFRLRKHPLGRQERETLKNHLLVITKNFLHCPNRTVSPQQHKPNIFYHLKY